MKKILIALLLCATLAGCGKSEEGEIHNNEETKENDRFDINEDDLKQNGYVEIADIAYVKVEQGEEKPVCYIEYYTNIPEYSFYLMALLQRDLNCDFVFTWNGEQYTLNDETPEDIEKAFPSDWKEIIEQSQEAGIENFITKATADAIYEEVSEFIEKYKNNLLKETTEEEKELNVLAQKTYNIGEDTFDFSLNQREDGVYDFMLVCQIKDKADAFSTHMALNSIMNSDEESLKPIIDDMNFSYCVLVSDDAMILRAKSSLQVIVKGEEKIDTLVDVEDYFSPEWVAGEEYHESDYGEQVVNFLVDFIEIGRNLE